MIKTKLMLIAILGFTIISGLTGCATGARVDKMTSTTTQISASEIKNKGFIRNITVSKVEGGSKTNPLWIAKIDNHNFKQALEKSLQKNNFFKNSDAKYNIEAQLLSLDQPLAGISLSVSCAVHYTLTEQESGKVLFDKNILNSYTANFSDSFIAATRLKLATEGAARENIQKLITELARIK